ncbi:MAG: DUF2141 domain-containing protein [Aquimonas sp.]|nr:DUF2141 domain-containing protein [Aquimonas sp.]
MKAFKTMARALAAALGLWLAGGTAAPAHAARLVVEVVGLESDEGAVVVEVFGSRAGFPRQPSYTETVAIAGGQARVEFPDLGPSEYVVHVWHDINGNGRLDRRFGAEPWSYSNSQPGRRASWEEAALGLGIDPLTVRINLAD